MGVGAATAAVGTGGGAAAGEDRRRAALGDERDGPLTARRGDEHRLGGEQKTGQQEDHGRLPRNARASSRSAARRRKSSRLSCSFFARPSAIATLARPSLKYSSSGMRVSPCCAVAPMSLRISCLCSSSLRERAGGGLL